MLRSISSASSTCWSALQMGDHFTFVTTTGSLDILGTPAGARGGYDELARTAVHMDIGGAIVRVASIDDLIRMKLAAGRIKDRMAAEELGALREEIAKRARQEE